VAAWLGAYLTGSLTFLVILRVRSGQTRISLSNVTADAWAPSFVGGCILLLMLDFAMALQKDLSTASLHIHSVGSRRAVSFRLLCLSLPTLVLSRLLLRLILQTLESRHSELIHRRGL
jgi:hypothetical protein